MNIVEEIIKQLGVSKEQAEGGLGLILKMVKEKLGGEFSQVDQAIPEANSLIGKAPADDASGGSGGGGGGLMGMLGGMAEKLGFGGLGKLAALASGFQKLGLSAESIQKFITVVMAFVEKSGGTVVKDLLAKVLSAK